MLPCKELICSETLRKLTKDCSSYGMGCFANAACCTHKGLCEATSSQKTEFWAQIRHYMPCLRAWGCLTVLIDLKISLQDLQCICWLLSMQSSGFICMWQANCFQLFIILYLILVMFYNILRLNSQQSLTIHCTNIPRNRISRFK